MKEKKIRQGTPCRDDGAFFFLELLLLFVYFLLLLLSRKASKISTRYLFVSLLDYFFR